jgi:sulfatase modifying factor 1
MNERPQLSREEERKDTSARKVKQQLLMMIGGVFLLAGIVYLYSIDAQGALVAWLNKEGEGQVDPRDPDPVGPPAVDTTPETDPAAEKAAEITAALARGDWNAVLALDPNNIEAKRKRTEAIAAALAKGDWKAVLALDPNNSKAQQLERTAKITAALKKGDWAEVLKLDPGNSKAKEMKVAAANKTKIDALLATGDWAEVLKLDPGNSKAMEMKVAAANKTKIDALLAKGDWKAVLAIDPNNSKAKQMELAAKITALLAKGDWKAVLALDPNNSEGKRLKAAAELLARPPITNTIEMQLKLIPGGTFTMGSPETAKDRGEDEHQHKVTISKAFYMQTTEVTQGQWKAVMGTEPWMGKSIGKEGANYPACVVTWDDAVAFCRKLSAKEGKMYRLPTEAQSEYACRAGTKTTWSFGNNEDALGDYAWYYKNAWDIGEKYAHLVGLKKPNAFGLYDMHGNVFEWCNDFYEPDYYKQSPETDPTGPARGSFRVVRGGSWFLFNARYPRSADRNGIEPNSIWANVGFRVVRELD